MRLMLPDSPPAVQLPAAAFVLQVDVAAMLGGASADDMRDSAVQEIAARFAEALHRRNQLLAPLAAAQLHPLSLLLSYMPVRSVIRSQSLSSY